MFCPALLILAIGAIAVVSVKVIHGRRPDDFLHRDRELIEPTPEQRAEVRRAIAAFRPAPVNPLRASRPVKFAPRRRAREV